MTRKEHYDRAETLLGNWEQNQGRGDIQRLGQMLAAAQVHATLALSAEELEALELAGQGTGLHKNVRWAIMLCSSWISCCACSLVAVPPPTAMTCQKLVPPM